MTATGRFTRLPAGRRHIDELMGPLSALYDETDRLTAWGRRLASVLGAGGRLLAVGNGGSASQAQHLTSELVGRYKHDRAPFSAIALCTETSALTAIGNDYGIEHLFARQVYGHGREGDILVALSTSGSSPNVLAAVAAAHEVGMTVWGFTGRPGNRLADASDDVLCVDSPHTATVQEIHQVAIHLLCAAFEEAL